jgi:hypothetical protein
VRLADLLVRATGHLTCPSHVASDGFIVIALLACVVLRTAVQAQAAVREIAGRVADATTGQPLAGPGLASRYADDGNDRPAPRQPILIGRIVASGREETTTRDRL